VRKLSTATVAIIIAISLYFTLFWGYDAFRVLSSPSYGLDDAWRSQFIFGIGRFFSLGPIGLIKLAAFFATLKLAVACICAYHIVDRFRHMARGQADSGILEAGLILVVLISIASVGPAAWSQSTDLMREHAMQLVLAGLAAALCIYERTFSRKDEPAAVPAAADNARWFSIWR
jgi:hypothetical protein